jgi:hypothetical protein
LYTAGCLLERYPEAMKWKQLGWTIFQQAVLDQIEPDGTISSTAPIIIV